MMAPVPEKPWHVEALPEAQWPRLLVSAEHAQALLDTGFDLELSVDQRYAEIVSSAEDLESLRLLGYPTVIVRDLLED
jgi:hypothetical protein